MNVKPLLMYINMQGNMASNTDYLNFVLEQIDMPLNVSYKKMMGEYILYFNGLIIGGIYDNRFMVKPFKSSKSVISEETYAIPYPGAKPMILVTEIDDKEFMRKLVLAVYSDLSEQ